jgi:hypothetical protein
MVRLFDEPLAASDLSNLQFLHCMVRIPADWAADCNGRTTRHIRDAGWLLRPVLLKACWLPTGL